MSSSPVRNRTALRHDNERHAQTGAEDGPTKMISWEPLPDPVAQDADAYLMTRNARSAATATSQHTDDRLRAPLLPHPQAFSSRRARFVALQEWEGYVTDIREEDFEARLWDLTGGARREEEEATIPFGEISERDRARMRRGSIFRWSIGYEYTEGGTKRRVSQIVFRDLPVVTKADLREASEWATETLRLLGL